MFKIYHNLFWVTSLAFLKVFSGIPIIKEPWSDVYTVFTCCGAY